MVYFVYHIALFALFWGVLGILNKVEVKKS